VTLLTPWAIALTTSPPEQPNHLPTSRKESIMPYFRDDYQDLGQETLTLTPVAIPGHVVNFGTVGNFTYLEMSTGLIYVREKDIFLHQSCIDECFRENMTYAMFDMECMALIKDRSNFDNNSEFQEKYKQLFNKYGVSMLHKEYFVNGTKEGL
jgi:hypothetical protein